MRRLIFILDNIDIKRLPEVTALLFAGLMLGFFPLALLGDYGSLTRGKFIVLGVMVCGLLPALLLSLVCSKRLGRAWGMPLTRPQKLLLTFWFIAVLSALLSPYPELILRGGPRYNGLATLTLMIFMALALSRWGRWQERLYEAAAISALLMSALCLWQLFGGNPLGLYPQGLTYADGGRLYQGRFLGTVGNVDMLSAYWCLTLPLLLGGVIQLEGRRKLLPGLALLLGGAVEAAAKVDSGLLALGASCLIMLPWLLPRRMRKWAWLLACVLLLIVLALLFCYDGPEQGTVWELSRVLHGDIRDEFGSSRVMLWKEAWSSMEGWRQWLLGSGPGTKSQHFTTVFQRVTESGLSLRSAVDSSHNEYLDYLLELGLIGLLLYAAALISTAAAACRMVRQGDRPTLILSWSMLCYCIQALFNFGSVVITPLFWAIWGLLLAHLSGARPPLLKQSSRAWDMPQ